MAMAVYRLLVTVSKNFCGEYVFYVFWFAYNFTPKTGNWNRSAIQSGITYEEHERSASREWQVFTGPGIEPKTPLSNNWLKPHATTSPRPIRPFSLGARPPCVSGWCINFGNFCARGLGWWLSPEDVCAVIASRVCLSVRRDARETRAMDNEEILTPDRTKLSFNFMIFSKRSRRGKKNNNRASC